MAGLKESIILTWKNGRLDKLKRIRLTPIRMKLNHRVDRRKWQSKALHVWGLLFSSLLKKYRRDKKLIEVQAVKKIAETTLKRRQNPKRNGSIFPFFCLTKRLSQQKTTKMPSQRQNLKHTGKLTGKRPLKKARHQTLPWWNQKSRKNIKLNILSLSSRYFLRIL